MIVRGAILLVGVVLVAVGCATRPPVGPGQPPVADRDVIRDGAPLRNIRPQDVTDAVPRPDPILALGNLSPYTVLGETYHILPSLANYRERGVASWYGTKFDGQKTSNGEIYDLYAASAAHKTLPIPCYARVTNLENGRSVVVRVNDRGPFHSDRLIDLSYGAAVKLGFMEVGTAPVEVEVINLAGIDDRRGTPLGSYRFVQLGAFGSESSAQRLRAELEALVAPPVAVSPVDTGSGLLYRVRIGPMQSNEEILLVQQRLEASGYTGTQLLP
ncbi:septal ring lytic transglycosylase RlpA family protein [Haliea sp. E1-2-M8]|uniref:septal ring lytic transglycosylase RlpA family protein n=1 Tax=Haliea sp. E1-2-M8 TaxID=3064706 RepID=UPI002719BF36|nr:septal ring lytic transglycosylase RlpA family protein [Haliea sp. E1-2-M8]MDO8861708.1 septal ring lytic transglycosylase RlpA family protein [Haliea sp. E1-2-M8]